MLQQQNSGGSMACSGMISPCVIKLWHSCAYGEYCHSERLLIRRWLLYNTQVTELECFVQAVRGRELKIWFDYCTWNNSCTAIRRWFQLQGSFHDYIYPILNKYTCTNTHPSAAQAKTQRQKSVL